MVDKLASWKEGEKQIFIMIERERNGEKLLIWKR